MPQAGAEPQAERLQIKTGQILVSLGTGKVYQRPETGRKEPNCTHHAE
jgi:hypothetical protein